jgi:hypothetical protein
MSNANVVRLAQFEGNQGLTARQAIQTANSRRITLLPNKSTSEDVTKGFDGRLALTDTWKNEKPVYPAWTGTMFVHGKKDAPLPKTVEYTDSETKEKWVFDTGAAAGSRNVILAINHGFSEDGKPLIQLHEDKNRIVVEITDPKQISIIENFPAKDGWYMTDPKYGIPVGEKADSGDSNTRYLYRIGDEKAGLLVRGNNVLVRRLVVIASGWPSGRFGVLALETAVQQKTEAGSPTQAAAKSNVGQLAANAEEATGKLVAIVKPELLQPIIELINATKQ